MENETGNYNTAMDIQRSKEQIQVLISQIWSRLSGNGDNTGNYNLGVNVLYNNTGGENVAMGYEALYDNTSGASNTAIGYSFKTQLQITMLLLEIEACPPILLEKTTQLWDLGL